MGVLSEKRNSYWTNWFLVTTEPYPSDQVVTVARKQTETSEVREELEPFVLLPACWEVFRDSLHPDGAQDYWAVLSVVFIHTDGSRAHPPTDTHLSSPCSGALCEV